MSDSTTFRILILPGDGIGQEVIPAAQRVLETTELPLTFTTGEMGWGCFQQRGTSLPDETLAAAREADAVLFGAVSSPSHAVPGYRSPIVALRRALDLYANIRPVTSIEQPNINMVVVRENTEGLYAGRERTEDDGNTAIAERVITRKASERIVRAAFDLARQRAAEHGPNGPAPRVTIVHKANVLRVSDGLFREAALHIAEQYPDVAHDELLVDNAALQLVQKPQRFNVIVTTNLFGDILSDIASYWGGGLGLATSANIGAQQALFEPVHGSAPDIAGQGIANPLAAIGCAALLLDYLAQSANATPELQTACRSWAARIQSAINHVLGSDVRTPDLGGNATTEEMTNAVIQLIKTA